MQRLKVLSVVSEVFPVIKTGGLADVAGALPLALAHESVDMVTLVPGYPAVLSALGPSTVLAQIGDLFGGEARLLAGRSGRLDLFVLEAPHLYARPGSPYLAQDGRDWPDNAFRFAALGRVAADIGLGAVPGFVPDAVHCHDWQAGLAPAFLHYSGRRRPATVLTIHNIAFPGIFPAALLPQLGLPPEAFTLDGVEYYGQIGFLKAGLQFADRITTVSPTYASEIQTPEGGMGLDGILRARADVVSGILNGVDDDVWNPASDKTLPSPFDASTLGARAANKRALQEEFALDPDPEALLLGVISRLSEQKGLDLVLGSLPYLATNGIQLVLLGAGDRLLEEGFRTAATVYSKQVGCRIGYDESLAHRIQGGADALAVPSRFEPCGLTQLCALRYGNVPIVSRVGGLADTVIDANEMAIAAGVGTGFQFAPVTQRAFVDAMRRVAILWKHKDQWRRLQENGIATDVSWARSARHYADLYREAATAIKV